MSFVTDSEKIDLSIYHSVSNQSFSINTSNTAFEIPNETVLNTFSLPIGKLINLGKLSIIVRVIGKDKVVGGEQLRYSFSYIIENDDASIRSFKTQYPELYNKLNDSSVFIAS